MPADARVADYVLDAHLDAREHRVSATATVTWRNTTRRTVDRLPFHLYMNGFRAENTAWMRSSRGRHRRSSQEREGAWGYIDIHSVRLAHPAPLSLASELEEAPTATVELDWREDSDPSTMTVDLPQPIGPGESVSVRFEFTTQLPRVIARTGYLDDFHAVAQWYPKIGVLEDETGWQAHTFTVYDEFYADFGNYEVTLDVPSEMVVGASGIRTAEEDANEGRKRLTYVAEMVHDFVWMADPDFVAHDGEYNGIRIRQLLPPERLADAPAHLAAQLAALESYEARYGPYPWSTVTIVHPPQGAEGAGGMEYPTLFTTSDRARIPGWVRATLLDERLSGIFTTVHEFGHQYFQGLFASREDREPWLDEGINTFSNSLAMLDRFGDDAWSLRLLSRKLHYLDSQRAFVRWRAFLEPVDRPASSFKRSIGNYGATVYARTALLMLTLRNLAGHRVFDRAFRAYCDDARFRHPRGADLEAALVAGIGERVNVAAASQEPVYLDVQHYLDQALRTTRQVDFSILRLANRLRVGDAGWHRDAAGALAGGEPPPHLDKDLDELEDGDLEALVAVHRAGAFEVPVDLRVEFADGSVERLTWDGADELRIFEWPGRQIRTAELDPDRKLLLEWRRLDNTARAPGNEEGDPLRRFLGDVAEALSLALMGSLGP